jgi:cytochrome c556
LAAIAQTVMADTHLIKNRGDDEKWYQYCAEMRDAAGAVNAAIHADDQPATTAAMLRLTKSCETCHAEFRKSAE